jgi:hypothetical protein
LDCGVAFLNNWYRIRRTIRVDLDWLLLRALEEPNEVDQVDPMVFLYCGLVLDANATFSVMIELKDMFILVSTVLFMLLSRCLW